MPGELASGILSAAAGFGITASPEPLSSEKAATPHPDVPLESDASGVAQYVVALRIDAQRRGVVVREPGKVEHRNHGVGGIHLGDLNSPVVGDTDQVVLIGHD